MTRMLSGHPQDLVVPAPPRSARARGCGPGRRPMTAFAGPWGVSFTANLTPDPETGLGKWTAETFIQALRTGRHEGQGRPILPPMPYPMYRNATDEDLRAIFAYLQSIPPIRNRVPQPIDPPEEPVMRGGPAGHCRAARRRCRAGLDSRVSRRSPCRSECLAAGVAGIEGATTRGRARALDINLRSVSPRPDSSSPTDRRPAQPPFVPQYPLWSDGAAKSRWIRLPEGAKIDVSDIDAWRFPGGTTIWKEFAWGGRKVETRMMRALGGGEWMFATYVWTEDQSDALLAPADGFPQSSRSRRESGTRFRRSPTARPATARRRPWSSASTRCSSRTTAIRWRRTRSRSAPGRSRCARSSRRTASSPRARTWRSARPAFVRAIPWRAPPWGTCRPTAAVATTIAARWRGWGSTSSTTWPASRARRSRRA